ncbi:MAG: hypothetical protein Q8891_13845 [Bacteroidota bacterium]|nr:hypothetical protein [Bacteroidota bacterium]
MKKILIISPHFPPSNLTAVHRARFFANHLPEFGWEPVILTVHEKYYEEELDQNLEKLLPPGLRVEKVKARRVSHPRIIGDIGLRAFFPMFKKAREIIKKEKIDFVYITIPSFYGALWGRWLHKATGVKYGIDYIDPWVHAFPGSNKLFSRHWLATKVSRFLEPIAVKKASLITGVAESYYYDVILRNPHLKDNCLFAAIPYGSEKSDHDAVKDMDLKPYLFDYKPGIIQMVYAGAMLPKAYQPLEEIFKAIQKNKTTLGQFELHFIGTGKSANDPNGYNIKSLAEKYGLWQTVVFEYPKRIPYLDVLVHLNIADGVFILGSTEAHYTPSKVYQAVLSEKPILAVLHSESTGVKVIRESHCGIVLDFDGEKDIKKIGRDFNRILMEFIKMTKTFAPENIDHSGFENYSAKVITYILSKKLDRIINKQD